jgi:hypothetical protein
MQCDTCHWHLKTVEHISWRVVSSSSQLTADSCSAVLLKANMTPTVQDLCRCRKRCCDTNKGIGVDSFGRIGRLSHYWKRSRHSKLQDLFRHYFPGNKQSTSVKSPPTVSIICVTRGFICGSGLGSGSFIPHTWKKVSFRDFVSCTSYSSCKKKLESRFKLQGIVSEFKESLHFEHFSFKSKMGINRI